MIWLLILCIMAYELYKNGKKLWPSDENYYRSCLQKIEQAAKNGKTETTLYFMSFYPNVKKQLNKDGFNCDISIMRNFYVAEWDYWNDTSLFGYKYYVMAMEKCRQNDTVDEDKFKKVRESL